MAPVLQEEEVILCRSHPLLFASTAGLQQAFCWLHSCACAWSQVKRESSDSLGKRRRKRAVGGEGLGSPFALRRFAAAAPSVDAFSEQSSSKKIRSCSECNGMAPPKHCDQVRADDYEKRACLLHPILLTGRSPPRWCIWNGPMYVYLEPETDTCPVAAQPGKARLRILGARCRFMPPLTSSTPNRSTLLLEHPHYHVSASAVP